MSAHLSYHGNANIAASLDWLVDNLIFIPNPQPYPNCASILKHLPVSRRASNSLTLLLEGHKLYSKGKTHSMLSLSCTQYDFSNSCMRMFCRFTHQSVSRFNLFNTGKPYTPEMHQPSAYPLKLASRRPSAPSSHNRGLSRTH